MDRNINSSAQKIEQQVKKEAGQDKQMDKYADATLEEIKQFLERVSKIDDGINKIRIDESLTDDEKKEEIEDLLIFEPAGEIDYTREKEILAKIRAVKEAELNASQPQSDKQSEPQEQKPVFDDLDLSEDFENNLDKMNEKTIIRKEPVPDKIEYIGDARWKFLAEEAKQKGEYVNTSEYLQEDEVPSGELLEKIESAKQKWLEKSETFTDKSKELLNKLKPMFAELVEVGFNKEILESYDKFVQTINFMSLPFMQDPFMGIKDPEEAEKRYNEAYDNEVREFVSQMTDNLNVFYLRANEIGEKFTDDARINKLLRIAEESEIHVNDFLGSVGLSEYKLHRFVQSDVGEGEIIKTEKKEESSYEKQIAAFKNFKNLSKGLMERFSRTYQALEVIEDAKQQAFKNRFAGLLLDLEFFTKFDEEKVNDFIKEGKFEDLLGSLEKTVDKLKADYELVINDMKNFQVDGSSKDYVNNQIVFMEDEVNNYFDYLYKNGLIKKLMVVTSIGLESDAGSVDAQSLRFNIDTAASMADGYKKELESKLSLIQQPSIANKLEDILIRLAYVQNIEELLGNQDIAVKISEFNNSMQGALMQISNSQEIFNQEVDKYIESGEDKESIDAVREDVNKIVDSFVSAMTKEGVVAGITEV